MDIKKLLYTVFEAEELTGRKAATWRRDILRRRIPYVKIGRQVRIPCEVIQDLIKRGYRFPVGEEFTSHARPVKDSQKTKLQTTKNLPMKGGSDG